MDWRDNLIADDDAILDIASSMRRIAVLGIKPESRASEPAHYVAKYLVEQGLDVVPVPVYYPEVTQILGRDVVRDLAAVGEVDVVDVFRRPDDLPQHLDDLLALRPRVVWLQLGIRHDEVAEQLARHGIRVVQDRCLLVEHRRARARGSVSVSHVDALVLWTHALDETVALLKVLGVPLEREQHDEGPVHWACELSGVHLAIYGAPGSERAPGHREAGSTLIGLRVASVDASVEVARRHGAKILSEPDEYPWGRRALVEAPDGRAIELNQAR